MTAGRAGAGAHDHSGPEVSRRTLARLLSAAERNEKLDAVAAPGGDAATAPERDSWTIGLTGPPGAGKSSLADGLVAELRRAGERVAVLAVDPSSPFSGGAVLGDRIRMGDHALDPGVLIRSLGSRGSGGGLSPAVERMAAVLEEAGFDWILVETVGVGQVEVDVMGIADTTVVVVTPGWGDVVQANKAGLLEIADLFAVNKADLTGATGVADDLRELPGGGRARGAEAAPIPVLRTVATTGEGVPELVAKVREWRNAATDEARAARRRERRRREAVRRARELLSRALDAHAETPAGTALVEDAAESAEGPDQAAQALVRSVAASLDR